MATYWCESELHDVLYAYAYKLNKNTIDFHSHPNLEIVLVLSGTGCFTTLDSKYLVKENDILIINKNTKHSEMGINFSVISIGIKNASITLPNDNRRSLWLTLFNKEINNYRLVFSNIYDEAHNLNNDSDEVIKSLYKFLTVLLKRSFKTEISKNFNNSNLSSDIEEIKNYIDQNYANGIDLDSITSKFSLSESTICHKFKKELGKSIIQYRLDKQLEEGKNLLSTTDNNICQIASIVGFTNYSYFTELFRKKFNCTPHDYRESLKK